MYCTSVQYRYLKQVQASRFLLDAEHQALDPLSIVGDFMRNMSLENCQVFLFFLKMLESSPI